MPKFMPTKGEYDAEQAGIVFFAFLIMAASGALGFRLGGLYGGIAGGIAGGVGCCLNENMRHALIHWFINLIGFLVGCGLLYIIWKTAPLIWNAMGPVAQPYLNGGGK